MADEVDEDNRCETTSVADPAKHAFYKKMLRKVRNPKASEKGLDSAEQLDGRLRIAARDGKVAEVRRLLVLGAQIKPDQNGCTAVHHASFVFWNVKSNIEIVTLLCEYGGHVNERDNLGQTALHKAVSNSLKRGLFDLETDSSNLEMIRKLVNLGADANAEDSSGQTLLHVTSMCRNFHNCYAVDELKLLVKMGCNMNVQDKQGNTALHLMAAMGQCDKSKILIQSGCDLDLQNQRNYSYKGNTALHLSAGHSDPSLMTLLIEAGASVNVLNGSNQTPLHYTLEKHLETVQLCAIEMLVKEGTNLYQRDNKGLSVFDIAATQSGNRKGRLVVKLLATCFTQPRSLQRSCRVAVRRFLKRPIGYPRLEELPIPQQIAAYLMFE